MVIDSIANADRYYGISANIDAALDYLKRSAQCTPEAGTYLVRDGVKAVVFSSSTSPAPQLEKHLRLMDIHYVIHGVEECGMGTFEGAPGYSEESDICFSDAPYEYTVRADEGMFYMVWPDEPHAPLAAPHVEIGNVDKIVLKVEV